MNNRLLGEMQSRAALGRQVALKAGAVPKLDFKHDSLFNLRQLSFNLCKYSLV